MARSLLLILLIAAPCAAAQQVPPIGIIDVFGLRSVSEQQVRAALQLHEGDPFPLAKAEVEHRIEAAVPGVVRARISGVCCDAGKSALFIGVEEAGASMPRFRPPPTGRQRLPDDVVQAGALLDDAITAAVLHGDAAEDQSRGYSIMHDSTARSIQERLIGFAVRDAALLREVLRSSADSSQRALAAEVMAYGADRQKVIGDLADAVLDPSSEVRNNAMRALALLAIFAREHPDLKLRVPADPFIEMLGSPIWTDRNKSSIALMQITQHRDPALLAELRARALPELVEMARWKSQAHAIAAFMILGRVGGLSDEAIYQAWTRKDAQLVIDAAMKSGR